VKIQETLKELEQAADKKSIRVTYEPIGGELGAGGLCKIKGEFRVIVDKRATDGEKVTVLATALARFSLDDVTISDETRALIARHAPKKPTPEGSGGSGGSSEPNESN
jgi:hypothetical protein